ncbi:hypothetical protein ACEWY4_021212 [Coilia grayii]|uniref:TFIIS N-terminal domain-containing protein n=1 Tax=Coilia grayii TaxID=363190 RepID=A0ABD1J9J2_9TELE
MAALKTVLDLKLQLKSAEPKTVVNILKKLQELDITIDILTETGIGKLVNSFRKHDEAGEVAKKLVSRWKKLVPKESRSKTKDKDSRKTSSNAAGPERTVESKKTEKQNQQVQSDIQKNSEASPPDDEHNTTASNKTTEGIECGVKDQYSSKSPKKVLQKETKTFVSHPRRKEDVPRCKGHTRVEKKSKREKDDSNKKESNAKGSKSKNKKDKNDRAAEREVEKQNEEEAKDHETPGTSFEELLNYDMVAPKRSVKKKTVKRPHVVKNKTDKTPTAKSHTPFTGEPSKLASSKNEVLDLLNVPLPLSLLNCDNLSSYQYFEEQNRIADTETVTGEDSSVFMGKRLKTKMQVYSGTKNSSLPTMMSLYQLCIRALQNNIDSLYEVGGVPFEILEPVLARCTPEQLFRIEKCNPSFIGLTDHLWDKHCQRDFKDARLQEYESWREMFFRLFEEREKKLASLTKSIVSAHSQRPKGRQIKMAFLDCAAKPPRNVRVQQVIHGTAGPMLQCHPRERLRAQCQDSEVRAVCRDSPRPCSSSTGLGQAQDPRKIKKVAPMMAKSLKNFKQQRRHR